MIPETMGGTRRTSWSSCTTFGREALPTDVELAGLALFGGHDQCVVVAGDRQADARTQSTWAEFFRHLGARTPSTWTRLFRHLRVARRAAAAAAAVTRQDVLRTATHTHTHTH